MLTRNATEDDAIQQGVPAKAVVAVDAPSNLTRSIETINRDEVLADLNAVDLKIYKSMRGFSIFL